MMHHTSGCSQRNQRIVHLAKCNGWHWMTLDVRRTGWWFGTWIWFFHILGIIIPTDFHIFQRGWNHQPENYPKMAGVGESSEIHPERCELKGSPLWRVLARKALLRTERSAGGSGAWNFPGGERRGANKTHPKMLWLLWTCGLFWDPTIDPAILPNWFQILMKFLGISRIGFWGWLRGWLLGRRLSRLARARCGCQWCWETQSTPKNAAWAVPNWKNISVYLSNISHPGIGFVVNVSLDSG